MPAQSHTANGTAKIQTRHDRLPSLRAPGPPVPHFRCLPALVTPTESPRPTPWLLEIPPRPTSVPVSGVEFFVFLHVIFPP